VLNSGKMHQVIHGKIIMERKRGQSMLKMLNGCNVNMCTNLDTYTAGIANQ
jgi:hypothetical protein